MGLPRNNKSNNAFQGKCLSQSSIGKRSRNVTSLSQPVPSTSSRNFMSRVTNKEHRTEQTSSRMSQGSPVERMISGDDDQLAGSVIRYLFALDRRKQVINKTRIIKNVFGGQGKHFHRVLNETKNLLSKVFGYRLLELEGNKYMLVNQLENTLPHVRPLESEGNLRVLLFLVLAHIFMHEESSSEDSLWEFLTSLGIACSSDHSDAYFGNVKHSITEVFVGQKYLEKIVVEKNDSLKVEFKWGPRAEYEFSRRASLEFVSQVYNGRPLNSWPLQFKALIAREKSNKPH